MWEFLIGLAALSLITVVLMGWCYVWQKFWNDDGESEIPFVVAGFLGLLCTGFVGLIATAAILGTYKFGIFVTDALGWSV